MQTQLHVEFQGTRPSPAVREKIRRHVSDLESFFGRITSCRVVLKVPGAHHRKGIYEFNMQLMLPNGKQVNVTRTPGNDERFTDLDFALNDMFKRARRRLQDRVRRMQGKVKTSRARTRAVPGERR